MKKQFNPRKYYINHNYFNNVNNNEKAYILGFISADGGVYNNSLTISQSTYEGEILLKWIKKNFDSNHVIYHRKQKKITHNIINILIIISPQIVEDLQKYNICKNKKHFFEFPNELNLTYFKPYLRGYFDGDGCVGIYNEKKIKNNKTYLSKYLKLSFYGTNKFIFKCNDLLPIELKGRIVSSKDNRHAEIIWTNKKARNFGKWLFEKNINLPIYVKIKKYIKYIEEFDNTPTVSERASKIVLQKDSNNNLINEYKSITEVKKILNISIGNCLIGLTKTAGGFIWEYKI